MAGELLVQKSGRCLRLECLYNKMKGAFSLIKFMESKNTRNDCRGEKYKTW